MLSKLMKQDYLSTRRLFFPSYLVFIIISVLNKILLEVAYTTAQPKDALEIISVIGLTLYVISIVALFVVTYVFICMHFYRTMSGEQGYLTHTLPVKTRTVINSKLFNSVIWQIGTFVLVMLSLLLLLAGELDGLDFQSIFSHYKHFVETNMYMSVGAFNVEIIITCFISLFSSSLMFYCSIAIGHLFNKHKVGGAVIAYIGIYMILQMLGTILMFMSGFLTIINGDAADFYYVYNRIMIYSIIMSIITTVIMYFVTEYIFRKRLNME
ncbi:hypothetical protein GPL15_02545 [Clostridium sp. MCC353]|uniref:hypothetical protein n=1 Tax=Clostridium sp. MCC353 TaxID=2592646 RepID=UPI001C017173|nr:hypothetical protein [Clostridium sp. MCC353]MBT9775386.1 hypothetical protein [Clostridium sp. MCC353]